LREDVVGGTEGKVHPSSSFSHAGYVNC